MSNVPITGPLSTTNPSDSYPTHLANDGRGGLHSVATLAERNAIPPDRRAPGMVVYVQADQTHYHLANNLATWGTFSRGGAPGTYPTHIVSAALATNRVLQAEPLLLQFDTATDAGANFWLRQKYTSPDTKNVDVVLDQGRLVARPGAAIENGSNRWTSFFKIIVYKNDVPTGQELFFTFPQGQAGFSPLYADNYNLPQAALRLPLAFGDELTFRAAVEVATTFTTMPGEEDDPETPEDESTPEQQIPNASPTELAATRDRLIDRYLLDRLTLSIL
jgi:hypothetical protein